EFVKSYKFYMSRPDIARTMFDSLATRANRTREDLNKPARLDTAAAQKNVDSLATKKDSTRATADTAKTVKPATGQPTLQPPVNRLSPEAIRKRLKHGPIRRLRADSLAPVQLKKQ
ncbi:MAG TPA: hypothetical protein VM187_17400, partial [Niastella sp.]|nr:hypothetical protein [Niastella sp.]